MKILAPSPGRTAADAPGVQQRVTVPWRMLLVGAGLLAVFIALWATIHFSSPNLAGNDGYFHIKFAQVMRQQGLVPAFTWLPLTILNAEAYYDHHFLYHVLLIPFTIGDLTTGAKWSAIFFASLAFFDGLAAAATAAGAIRGALGAGLFAISEAFLYRLSMIRVQAVSLLLLLLALHLLLPAPPRSNATDIEPDTLYKRHRWLLPLAFVYTWLYDAFPLLLVMVVIYVLVTWLFDRKMRPAPLLYAGLGVGLGLLINPYFPKQHYFHCPALPAQNCRCVRRRYQRWQRVVPVHHLGAG